MKLSLTPQEITEGKLIKRWGKKRLSEIRETLAKRQPIGIFGGAMMGNRVVSLVYPHQLEPGEQKRFILSFTPVWCMAMVGCHIRSSEIRILVVKFDHGQFEFSDDGEKSSTATMSGPGVDPSVVRDSETKLVQLLESYPNNHAVMRCRNHIAQHFSKK